MLWLRSVPPNAPKVNHFDVPYGGASAWPSRVWVYKDGGPNGPVNVRTATLAATGFLALTLLVSGGGTFVASASPVQVRGQAPPPGQTPEDARLALLQEELKDLQRREIGTEDLAEKDRLLGLIIDYCIELGTDYSGYEKKREDVRARLNAEAKRVTDAQGREKRIQDRKERAKRAVEADPPRWDDAWRDLAAIPERSRDDEVRALIATVRRGQQYQLYRRIAVVVLLTIVALALMIPALKALGKGARPRELEMIEGPQPGEVFRLEKDTTSLGAIATEADIVITDPFRKISRRHCEITRSGKHYFLTDGSTNGTLINGKPAPKGEPVLLKKNDRIALAEDVVLRFR